MRLVHVMTAPESLFFFLRGQVAFMRERGIEPHGIATPGEFLDRFAERDHVPVTAVSMPRKITPLQDLVAVARLWRVLRRLDPDIVQGGTPKGGLLGMMAATLAGVPVRIYHIRGLPLMTATGARRHLYRWSERISCSLAHHVLCVSHSVRDVVIAEGLCPAGKIETLRSGSGNGVDGAGRFSPARLGEDSRQKTRARYGIPDDALLIGFVGRLIQKKGIVDLMAAWDAVKDEHPEMHLVVGGPFEAVDPIPDDVKRRMESDPRVHVVGYVDDTPAFYTALDLFVFPTYFHEGFPNVPLEAAAMGLPVIATTIAGCTDAVEDGVTGTLVAPRDPVALTAAIRRYVADPELRRRHGAAGRERVLREFRPELIWQALFETYQRLLAEHAPQVAPHAPAGTQAAEPVA
ncbi:MAG: capsule biosynthesis protein CapM [Labilithrix sp.]|nr:capsule biosynthesis protein CapM [Labilithrix sp.]